MARVILVHHPKHEKQQLIPRQRAHHHGPQEELLESQHVVLVRVGDGKNNIVAKVHSELGLLQPQNIEKPEPGVFRQKLYFAC